MHLSTEKYRQDRALYGNIDTIAPAPREIFKTHFYLQKRMRL